MIPRLQPNPTEDTMFKFMSVPAALFFVAILCELAAADVIQIPNKIDGQRVVGTVYKMTVTPAKEAVPAFKYRLTVEPHKTIPGNAITHYLRSLGENSLNGPWKTAQAEFGMDVFGWYGLETKAEDIPLDKLKKASGLFDSYVENHLRRATLCRDCDWGLAEEELRGPETIGFLLPSVQQTRSMARVLMLRNRLAVIEGRYEDSIDHLRMTYTLGQNVSQMKFLVADLVGIAEVGMANNGMVDLIAAKDSPNMYWALAELPQPILSIRESLRLEASFGLRYFPVLMDVELAEYSKEKWSDSLDKVIDGLPDVSNLVSGPVSGRNGEVMSLQTKLLAFGAGIAGYSSAKNRLLDAGMNPAKVEKMAVAQVLLIDAARDCRALMNEVEKAFYIPYEHVGKFDRKIETALRLQSPLRLGRFIASTFSPAFPQVRQAEVRVQAEVNVLMAIESIRNHIAMTGNLPASLDELDLPVRNDPFTGQPIDYQLKGETAVLWIGHYVGSPRSQQYEISIAPK